MNEIPKVRWSIQLFYQDEQYEVHVVSSEDKRQAMLGSRLYESIVLQKIHNHFFNSYNLRLASNC